MIVINYNGEKFPFVIFENNLSPTKPIKACQVA